MDDKRRESSIDFPVMPFRKKDSGRTNTMSYSGSRHNYKYHWNVATEFGHSFDTPATQTIDEDRTYLVPEQFNLNLTSPTPTGGHSMGRSPQFKRLLWNNERHMEQQRKVAERQLYN